MTNQLKQHGLKATLPRLKILNILDRPHQRHLSAEDIYQYLRDAGEDVALATIYRVLTQFEQAGILIRHNFENGRSVFELDQGEHHDHLVCTNCGKVIEFVDESIEKKQLAICQQHQFKMTEHSMTLYGVCQQCQDN